MATRLASSRGGCITITRDSQKDDDNVDSNNQNISTASVQLPSNEIITLTADSQQNVASLNQNIVTTISLDQVLQQKKFLKQSALPDVMNPQKKFILQTATTFDGVPVIDVVPIENSDSNSEIAIQNDSRTSSPSNNDCDIKPQITAQVAVVQSENYTEPGPHYITVSAEGAVRSYAPLTTVVTTQDNGASQPTYHVQYVDSVADMYQTQQQGQNQLSYPVYAVGDFGTNNQQYFTTSSTSYTSTPVAPTNSSQVTSEYIIPDDGTILRSSQSDNSSPPTIGTELIYVPEQNRPSVSGISTDGDNTHGIAHATKVSPATVNWLVDNYETAEGVSLPRSTLYNHYMRHCKENKLDAVNAASFGKLIRSVFTGLRTRRLGTRGNSKYHYYGIRIKPGSNILHSAEEKIQNIGNNQVGDSGNSNSSGRSRRTCSKPDSYDICAQYLGDGTNAIPTFPQLNANEIYSDDVTPEDVDTLRSMYREHCEAFLDAILNLEFGTIESLWREFWRAQDNNNSDECEEERYLSKQKLFSLCKNKEIRNFIKAVDYAFYQNVVDVLIPDVLRPIPSSLTQLIRNFAKNLEVWLTSAMTGCPSSVIEIKLSAVLAFGQMLRRYTSLNHLAQAARAVLQNSSQISQMLNDLNRVDFRNVQEQASWVCQCGTATVQKLENDFKAALLQQNSLEEWAQWLRMVVDSALEEYKETSSYITAARQFLLKWSFYSSMVIRDLTLRSAASFGSFHLIRLLYDEYMFFIVEHKVAEASNSTPIAVMSEMEHSVDLNTVSESALDF